MVAEAAVCGVPFVTERRNVMPQARRDHARGGVRYGMRAREAADPPRRRTRLVCGVQERCVVRWLEKRRVGFVVRSLDNLPSNLLQQARRRRARRG